MTAHAMAAGFPRAVIVAGLVTAMAVPRIVAGGLDIWAAMPVAFLAMTFISLAAISWSARAGMCGLFPSWRIQWPGLWAAVILGFGMAVIFRLYVDPVLKAALSGSGHSDLAALRYPATFTDALALMLWAAGFETMFFQAGAVCFFSRLTDHRWLAITGAVSFRALVTSIQISHAGIVDGFPLFLVASAASSGVACILFAKTGLPAAMLFSAVLSLHAYLVGLSG